MFHDLTSKHSPPFSKRRQKQSRIAEQPTNCRQFACTRFLFLTSATCRRSKLKSVLVKLFCVRSFGQCRHDTTRHILLEAQKKTSYRQIFCKNITNTKIRSEILKHSITFPTVWFPTARISKTLVVIGVCKDLPSLSSPPKQWLYPTENRFSWHNQKWWHNT